MKCPYCGCEEDKVVDSRDAEGAIRRRRECSSCEKRWTTYEKMGDITLFVIKKDGTIQEFDRQKLMRGLLHACRKRPVQITDIERIVDNVENMMMQSGLNEVSVKKIGQLAMRELKKLDPVAYVRFVSVYKDFKDVDSFIEELEKLKNS
ncbi:MAG: transcriptional regulator NrdR [Oscillospiraceae bacterium]|nr:transcriptional regulator NrdR [Oscillospiraceae bacterium]